MAPQGYGFYTKWTPAAPSVSGSPRWPAGPQCNSTNDQTSSEYPGSWSADGNWFTYPAFRDGKANLVKVKTTGQATPVVVKAASILTDAVPIWSPDGETILLGENLYSAGGQTVRSLSEHEADGYVFGQDGKLLYGLGVGSRRGAIHPGGEAPASRNWWVSWPRKSTAQPPECTVRLSFPPTGRRSPTERQSSTKSLDSSKASPRKQAG